MKKSVYSLVLMDDVVDAIDRLAYRQHTSRSGLINQILAEHVALSTPEKRMRDVFSCLEELMDETFLVQPRQGSSVLSMRSALRFKYKPTIRYSVELYPEPADGVIGQLKIGFRTQNAGLLDILGQFFNSLSDIEGRLCSGRSAAVFRCDEAAGKFSRDIRLPEKVSERTPEAVGNAIASYIRLLDSLIKQYFADLDDPDEAVRSLEDSCRQTYEVLEGI